MGQKSIWQHAKPTNILNFVLKEERRSGVLLLIAAAAALFAANNGLSENYFDFIGHKISLGAVSLDVKHWISEGLMALFFLVVVLEIKRELIDGELRSWKKASFPVFAAIGGMLVPALFYSLINPSAPQSNGWAIPIATDIAIAVSVLALLGNKIPKGVRVILLALAIIDDVGSILIIALFYSQPTNVLAFLGAITAALALILFRKSNQWLLWFSVIGLLLWYCLLLSGVSGTMAGVILAALSPLATQGKSNRRLQLSEKIEDYLLPITAYAVVPLFVFANAGLVFDQLAISMGDGLSVFAGAIVGLVFGKPLGIFAVSWLACNLGLIQKPLGVRWSHIAGIGCLAGIGFTISILIADLSFGDQLVYKNAAIFGVFVASAISAVIGLIILKVASKDYKKSI